MLLERPHTPPIRKRQNYFRKALFLLKAGIIFATKQEYKSGILGPQDAAMPYNIRVPKRYFLRFGALEALKHIMGGISMNKVVMLNGAESEEILLTCIENKVPAIMSYLSKDKWHVAKVLLTELSFPQGVGPANRLVVEGSGLEEKPRPINIQINQPVGISFKHSYGKFVFDTTVLALEPSPAASSCEDKSGGQEHGGRIILAVPDRMEVLQRRSYFRVNVPGSINVNVTLWHRSSKFQDNNQQQAPNLRQPTIYYRGKLIDISAGGAQVMVLNQNGANDPAYDSSVVHLPSSDEGRFDLRDYEHKPSFKKGQFIGLRFTPMPYETPLMFNAQIRHIMPSEDNKSIYLGLQIVGLEASPEGRQVLSRIAGVVERYYQLNLSSAKQLDPPAAGIRTPIHNPAINESSSGDHQS